MKVRFTKGEGLKGVGEKKYPQSGKDPELDIDCKGCGGAGGCKPAGPKNDPLPLYKMTTKGTGD